MKNDDLIEVLDRLLEKVQETELLGSGKKRIVKTVQEIKDGFRDLEVEKKYAEVYRSLVGKGNKLVSCYKVDADSKELQGKTKYYVGYLNAAYGDFTGQVQNIQPFYRLFLVCSILFLALSPMFLTPIFPLIFIIPIVLAMKGVKQRSRNGFLLAMLVAPASLMTAVMWIRNGVQIVMDFQAAVEAAMRDSGFGQTGATVLTIGSPVLGSVLFVLALLLISQGYKVRKLFV